MILGVFFTALGYLVGAAVLRWVARKRTLLTEGVLKIAAWAVVGGAIGAKLGEYLFDGWPLRIPVQSILDPNYGGRALLGGLIGGWIAAVIARRRMGIKRSTGDLFAFALPAGEAVGRIGCYFNGCCYGKPTTFAIAIYQHGAWRHPTQIYSAITAALIFTCISYASLRFPLLTAEGFPISEHFSLREKMSLRANRMSKLPALGKWSEAESGRVFWRSLAERPPKCEMMNHVRQEGDLFKLYLLLFGFSRFLIEFLREGPTFVLGLTAMQWFCLELFIFALIGLWLNLRSSSRKGLLEEAGVTP